MFKATTHGIEISVVPVYDDKKSEPANSRFFWAYRVVMRNRSDITVQLNSRYWKIIDATGKIEEVSGVGVVGQQPVLTAGSEFTYTSGCPLSTSSGIMQGHYLMQSEDGSILQIEIPAFSLDMPNMKPTMN